MERAKNGVGLIIPGITCVKSLMGNKWLYQSEKMFMLSLIHIYMDIFYDKIVTGQWGIIGMLIICAIPTALLLVVLSRKMALKVRKMNQLLDSQEETNYNLNSIENGIQMLVEANEQKEKENLQLKKTRFIRNFIRNDFKNQEEVLQESEKVFMEIKNSEYLTVLLLSLIHIS